VREIDGRALVAPDFRIANDGGIVRGGVVATRTECGESE